MPALYIIRDLVEAHALLDYGASGQDSVEGRLIRASQAAGSVANIYAKQPGIDVALDVTKAEKIADLARRIKEGPLAGAYTLADDIERIVQEAAALLEEKREA